MDADSALSRLETETPNPATSDLDALPIPDLLARLHDANAAVWPAVAADLPRIATVVDAVVDRLRRGGRLIYVGAGTSGRLGVLDASECPPTFGVTPGLVQGIIAGGEAALSRSIEGAEDRPDLGASDLLAREVNANDAVIGVAASGRTPYVIGALDAASHVGAFTAAIVNVSDSELSRHAAVTIAAITGPEPLTGSTRLLAGTAQKLILNLISTATMVRLGKVYGNLMVDVRATNAKLRDRAVRIVIAVTGADHATAEHALNETNGNAKVAIAMVTRSVSAAEAVQMLEVAGGDLRAALTPRQ